MQKEIKFKIQLFLLLLVVVSVIVTLNLFFYQSHESEMASQTNAQQSIIAKTIAMSIDNTLEHMKEELVSLAGLLSERGLGSDGLKEFIEYAFGELSEDFKVDLYLIDPSGDLVYTTSDNTDINEMESDLLSGALLVPPGQLQMATGADGKNELRMLTSIRKQSDLLGAIMMVLDVNEFNEKFLGPLSTGLRRSVWIMDDEGTLIYHPTMQDMVGKNIRSQDKQCFKCHKSFNAELKILDSPEVGNSSYIAPYGEDKLLAFKRTNEIGWIVCVSVPYSEVTKSMKKSMNMQSLLILAIFISTFLAAFIVIRINRQRERAEVKADYADKVKEYAGQLEVIVNERTKELRSEKEKLHAVIESISAGICIFDKTDKCIWQNRVMSQWSGSQNPASISIAGILCLNAESTGVFNSVIEDGAIRSTEFVKMKNLSGTFDITVTPFHMPDGSTNALLVMQDVTELKRAHEQMIQSEKLAALSRLSAGVSHEIGNPLTSISSYVQILMDMEFDDFTTESLETISKHVRRIEAILEKMSAFSSSKDDGMAPHDIAEVVRSTVEIVRYDRRTKNIDIQVDMPEEIPDVVVNASQMVQVISNLILNAADAMPDGGKLVIRATSDEGFVNISFKDNGVGIETENLKKVFDPFFTTKQAGTGLGLAVCHSIINLFGGDINVESVKGEGSTFTIKLPAYKNE